MERKALEIQSEQIGVCVNFSGVFKAVARAPHPGEFWTFMRVVWRGGAPPADPAEP
jgi:hypothetical protein